MPPEIRDGLLESRIAVKIGLKIEGVAVAEDLAAGGITLRPDKRELEERLNLRIEDTLRNLQRAYDARPRDDGFDYETPLLHLMAQVQQLRRRVKEVFDDDSQMENSDGSLVAESPPG